MINGNSVKLDSNKHDVQSRAAIRRGVAAAAVGGLTLLLLMGAERRSLMALSDTGLTRRLKRNLDRGFVMDTVHSECRSALRW
jgi:hypothetical protein